MRKTIIAQKKHRRAFTLIELVVVMFIMGLLLMVAVPRVGALYDRQLVEQQAQLLEKDLIWLRSEARKMGRSFTPQAMAMLEELAPQDGTLVLASELEKLALYLDDRDDALITEDDVAAIVTPSPSRTIFNLTDALVEGRTVAVLAAYRDCLYLGSKPPQILRQLIDTVRRLLEVQSMLADGMSQSAIRGEIKRHEYYVKKLIGQARRLSTEALSSIYCYLVDCDVKSKSTAGLDMEAFVEEILINCCATIAVRGRRAYR